jgi:hypothetical protein
MNYVHFLPYFLLQLFKILKILFRGAKIPFSSICYEHKKIYEQTTLVMQIRIDTQRTLHMQDLGSHGSSVCDVMPNSTVDRYQHFQGPTLRWQ